MAALAQELKHRYPSRFIVLDLPPILSRADVLGFSSHIDALLLVIEEGRTSSVEVEQAVAAAAGTVPILGVFSQIRAHTTDQAASHGVAAQPFCVGTMYQTYYQLKTMPFTLLPDPEFLYLGAKHKMALSL